MFTPECELFFENGPSSAELFDGCLKNPGHPMFIPVNEFTMDHLPRKYQTQKCLDHIRHLCKMTVKVHVFFTSHKRPDMFPNTDLPYPFSQDKGKDGIRCGTGFLDSFPFNTSAVFSGQPCPCRVCKRRSGKPKMKYFTFWVNTAIHVIYDTAEAARSIFELFYDSPSRKGVKFLYGLRAMKISGEEDGCRVECVSHDEELFDILNKITKHYHDREMINFGVIISHPHGSCKHITIGKMLHYTVSKNNNTFPTDKSFEFGTDDRCRLLDLHHYHSEDRTPLPDESLDAEQENPLCLDTEIPMTPGKEYSLPAGLTFTLPSDSDYLFRCHDVMDDSAWVTFPPGTIYITSRGEDISDLLAGAEFSLKEIKKYASSTVPAFVTYNITTCPGSSGAEVYYNRGIGIRTLHCGKLSDGTNRGGNNMELCQLFKSSLSKERRKKEKNESREKQIPKFGVIEDQIPESYLRTIRTQEFELRKNQIPESDLRTIRTQEFELRKNQIPEFWHYEKEGHNCCCQHYFLCSIL